jgi:hypothetical protein
VRVGPGDEPVGHPDPPAGGLSSETRRSEVSFQVHVVDMLPKALRAAAESPSLPEWSALFRAFYAGSRFDPSAAPRRGPRGPKGRSDEWYARLAADYVAACEEGGPSPVKALAKARRCKRPNTIAVLVSRARERGLLTDAPRSGVAGGALTPKALALLKTKPTKKRR